MKLTRCPNNPQHYYDMDKHDECPHCAGRSNPVPTEKEEEGMMDYTRSIMPDSMIDELPDELRSYEAEREETVQSADSQPEETFEETMHNEPVSESGRRPSRSSHCTSAA